MIRRILISVVSILLATGAYAQTPTGSLVGRITDSSRSDIVGATVRVQSAATNDIRTAQTGAGGEYTISNLAPGVYSVSIEKEGFKRLHESGLVLQVQQTARLDAQLEIGAISQSVEIKADAPLLNTENASRGEVIAPAELTQMPLNGRDFNDLAFMAPGVQAAEQGSKGSPYVVNGARADASNVVVDGFNNQNARDAGAQARPPLEGLQEFKVQTSGYSAEYGRLAGGVISMVLKSGGNQFHGAVFEYLRNDAMDARNFFDGAKSKLRRNQLGASATGPVTIPKVYSGKDKLFFFFNYQGSRTAQQVVRNRTVLTPEAKSGP